MTAKTKKIRQFIFTASLAPLICCGSVQLASAQIQPAANQPAIPKMN